MGPGLLNVDVSRSLSHTTLDSSEGGTGSLKRPVPNNTQHSQEPYIPATEEFEPAIPANELPQTHGHGERFSTTNY